MSNRPANLKTEKMLLLMFCISVVLVLGVMFYERWKYDTERAPRLVDPETTMITLGPDEEPDCQVSIPLMVWEDMNRAGVWGWPAACVEAKKALKE